MKHQLSTIFAGIVLLGGLVQARYVVVMDAGSTRTTASLYSEAAASDLGVNVVTVSVSRAGGKTGVHNVIKNNKTANEEYFTNLLTPLASKLKAKADDIVDVYIFGTGAVRKLSEAEEGELWNQISEAIKVSTANAGMEGVQFRLVEAHTITAEEESQLMMVAAQRKHKAQVAIDIGGESSQVAFGTTVSTFESLGAVRASQTVSENLLPPLYIKELEQMTYDPNKNATEEAQTQLAHWMGKTENPCLMKADDWVDMVTAFSTVKPKKDTYRAVVPFIGTGDYEACLKSIEVHAFNETKFDMVIPENVKLVGMSHLYFNQRNLQRVGVLKDLHTRTVGDFVEAAKTVCATKLKQWEDHLEKRNISPHGLIELCWSTTYSAAMLTSLLGLDHTFQIIIDEIGWSTGKAINLLGTNY